MENINTSKTYKKISDFETRLTFKNGSRNLVEIVIWEYRYSNKIVVKLNRKGLFFFTKLLDNGSSFVLFCFVMSGWIHKAL